MTDTKTESMVERVARAIYESRPRHPRAEWSSEPLPVRNGLLKEARAAMDAFTPLRDALLPFARLGGPNDGVLPAYHDCPNDLVVYENSGRGITAGDVRAARAALGWLHAPGWKEPEWGDPDGTHSTPPSPTQEGRGSRS